MMRMELIREMSEKEQTPGMTHIVQRSLRNLLQKRRTLWLGTFFSVIAIFSVVAFYLADRSGELSLWIRSAGPFGVFLAIGLMALWCVTPVPSEGLLLVFLRIYGLLCGLIYAWIGFMISTMMVYWIARSMQALKSDQKKQVPLTFRATMAFIEASGSVGLLMARLLPVPAVVFNYAAGLLPSISLFPYVWTAAVSILPYYLMALLLYVGVSTGVWGIAVVSGVPILLVLWMGRNVRKRLDQHRAENEMGNS
ncbi:hypothetical protein ATW55_02080 [Ferroacidibacillus organovorans]|uniref:TVP38/TMEM64 family membrane protein n=2 Tax=Ferroacidibacillus organovorans TaxID=1765683 RepID=A0A101XNM0_9BACL|nr:hypothetical protein ATW55_02080 [Ferroacidibacillus organovorans]